MVILGLTNTWSDQAQIKHKLVEHLCQDLLVDLVAVNPVYNWRGSVGGGGKYDSLVS